MFNIRYRHHSQSSIYYTDITGRVQSTVQISQFGFNVLYRHHRLGSIYCTDITGRFQYTIQMSQAGLNILCRYNFYVTGRNQLILLTSLLELKYTIPCILQLLIACLQFSKYRGNNEVIKKNQNQNQNQQSNLWTISQKKLQTISGTKLWTISRTTKLWTISGTKLQIIFEHLLDTVWLVPPHSIRNPKFPPITTL